MKAYSKGAKRRNKGYRALCERQEAQDPIIQTIEKDDPLKTVREARARQTKRPESVVLGVMFAEDAGRAIEAGARNKDEASRMWETWDKFTRAHRASVFHSTGKSMFPAVSKIEYIPERFETRDDWLPDLRSEEDRYDAAMRAWRHWKHILGFLSPREWHSIMDASRQITTLHKGGALTVHGITFVASLRTLCGVVDAYEGRR